MEFRFELSAFTDGREETEAEARERLRDVIVQLQHVGFTVEVIDSPFDDVATGPAYHGGGMASPDPAPSTTPYAMGSDYAAITNMLRTWNVQSGDTVSFSYEEVDPVW